MKRITALQFHILALLITAVVACSPAHDNDSTNTATSSTGGVTAQSIDAFQSTVYAFGLMQNCVKCHDTAVSPRWMNSDINQAYAFARPLVDFSNPTVSNFAVYVGNNHCNDPVCADPSNTPIMQGLLTQWAEIEINQGNGAGQPSVGGSTLASPPYATLTMPIPSPLPLITSNQVSVMRFDLSQLTPAVPALNGAFLEISIQSYNALVNEYKIFNPRIVGNSAPVTVNGIHVYLRAATGSGLGTEDVNQGDLWSGVQATAAPVPLPSPLPTGPITAADPLVTISLGVPAQSAADVITIGFVNIQ
jgi:hypothetical protein